MQSALTVSTDTAPAIVIHAAGGRCGHHSVVPIDRRQDDRV